VALDSCKIVFLPKKNSHSVQTEWLFFLVVDLNLGIKKSTARRLRRAAPKPNENNLPTEFKMFFEDQMNSVSVVW
jgi:hypothetical protein